VHLTKRRRLPAEFDLDRLAKASIGFVGAEIEQAVVDAMYGAFADGGRDITIHDLMGALARGVPLSRSQREVIESLRDWLRQGRAQSASFAEKTLAETSFVPFEVFLRRRPLVRRRGADRGAQLPACTWEAHVDGQRYQASRRRRMVWCNAWATSRSSADSVVASAA